MHKKLIMVCMAIAAFAAVVFASAASASPALTKSGVLLASGSAVEAKNVGNAFFSGAFGGECSTIVMKATLTENSGTSFKITVPIGGVFMTGTGAAGDCTSALGSVKWTYNSELCMETVKGTDNLNITGCAANPVTFTLEVTGTGPCKYSTASMTGTIKTATTSTINLNAQPFSVESGGFFCPASSSLTEDLNVYSGGTLLTNS